MSEIIDEFEVQREPEKKGYFNLFSFLNGLSLVALMIYISSFMKPTIENGFIQPPLFVVCIFPILLISGLILTFLSFRRKGKFVVLKWLGAIINLFFIIAILGSIIFAYYIDSQRL